jgi:hypothetical protein
MSRDIARSCRAVLACVAVTAVLHAVAVRAQPPSTPTLSGTVVDSATDSPIRGARVAARAGVSPSAVMTDDRGHFSIELAPDTTLTVTKAGYASETLKVPVSTAREAAVRVVMTRGAAIAGRVAYTSGAPAVNATVVARRAGDTDLERPLTTSADDLGEFRFGGLAEGQFQIGVLVPEADGRPSFAVDSNYALVHATDVAPLIRVRTGETVDVGEITATLSTTQLAGGTAAETRTEGTATVNGSVKDARGRPMHVTVTLVRSGSPARRFYTTDDEGRFHFDRVAAGTYAVEAARPGAPAIRFGQRSSRQPGTTIDVRDGETVNDVDFVLTSGSAIAGTVFDEYGEPMQGATVRVLQIVRVSDQLMALAAPGVEARVSDDRGAYRIFGMLTGRYLVVVTDALSLGGSAGNSAYAPTFYSGTTNVANAIPVTLDTADATRIDIAIHRERTFRIIGTALDSRGRPFRAVSLHVSQRSGGIISEPTQAVAGADGVFVFENVPPGDYVVQGRAPILPTLESGKPIAITDMEFGRQYVTVTDADPPALQLRTSPGATIHGRIRVDEGASTVPLGLAVYPFPTDFDSSPIAGSGPDGLKRRDDGSFDVAGVTGPRRFGILLPVEGWYVKEARVGGVDALDTPFDFGFAAREFNDVDIVVSQASATITGFAESAASERVGAYTVLLFSTEAEKWHSGSQSIRLEHSSQNGGFRVAGLPPGSYYALALNDGVEVVANGDWQDPATLERLRPLATRITVGDGETRTIALRLTTEH